MSTSRSTRWSFHGVLGVMLAIAAIWVLSLPQKTPSKPLAEDDDFPTVQAPKDMNANLWLMVLKGQTSQRSGPWKSDPNTMFATTRPATSPTSQKSPETKAGDAFERRPDVGGSYEFWKSHLPTDFHELIPPPNVCNPHGPLPGPLIISPQ